jgi:hypothetical protein
MANLL